MSLPGQPGRSHAMGRRGVGLLAAATAALVALAGCAGSGGAGSDHTHSAPAGTTTPMLPDQQVATTTPASEPTPTQAPVPEILGRGVEPARLIIPAIGLDEELLDLGLQPDGSLEVPADWDRVGWFAGGGRPGGRGPLVMVGHVDSLTGPAVFFELTTLVVGDLVEVTDVNGNVHSYRVYRVEDLPKDAFPTHEVFGAINADELRLITCTGDFDPSALRHLDNRVVFAEAL